MMSNEISFKTLSIEIQDVITDILMNIYSNLEVSSIILFGSRARGDFHDKSDIDLIFILNDLPIRKNYSTYSRYDIKGFNVDLNTFDHQSLKSILNIPAWQYRIADAVVVDEVTKGSFISSISSSFDKIIKPIFTEKERTKRTNILCSYLIGLFRALDKDYVEGGFRFYILAEILVQSLFLFCERLKILPFSKGNPIYSGELTSHLCNIILGWPVPPYYLDNISTMTKEPWSNLNNILRNARLINRKIQSIVDRGYEPASILHLIIPSASDLVDFQKAFSQGCWYAPDENEVLKTAKWLSGYDSGDISL